MKKEIRLRQLEKNMIAEVTGGTRCACLTCSVSQSGDHGSISPEYAMLCATSGYSYSFTFNIGTISFQIPNQIIAGSDKETCSERCCANSAVRGWAWGNKDGGICPTTTWI